MTEFTTWRSLVDGEEISAIPDSVVNRWPIQSDNFPLEDTVGNNDFTSIVSPSIESESNAIGERWALFDGIDDAAETDAEYSAGDCTVVCTLEFDSEIDSDEQVYGATNSGSDATNLAITVALDGETNEISALATSDENNTFAVSGGDAFGFTTGDPGYVVNPGERIRAVLIIDTDDEELKLGINGSVHGTVDISGETFQTTDNLRLAYEPSGDRRHFGGFIDEPMNDSTAWDVGTLQVDYDRQPWS